MSKGFRLWSRVGSKAQRFFRNLVVDPHMFSQVTRLDKRLGASWTLITNTKILYMNPYPLRNINFEWNVWYSPGQECFLSPVCVAVWRCKWDFCMNALPQNWQTKSFFPWNEKQEIYTCGTVLGILTRRCARQQVRAHRAANITNISHACLLDHSACYLYIKFSRNQNGETFPPQT